MDWRTFTIADRLRCDDVIFGDGFTGTALATTSLGLRGSPPANSLVAKRHGRRLVEYRGRAVDLDYADVQLR